MRYPRESGVFHAGDHRVRFELPVRPGTNLVEKYVEVFCGVDSRSCAAARPFPAARDKTSIEINGVVYGVERGEDVAAGNLYEWTRYSTARDGRCLSVTFVLHSGQLGAYSEPVSSYDREEESTVFDAMARSLRFGKP